MDFKDLKPGMLLTHKLDSEYAAFFYVEQINKNNVVGFWAVQNSKMRWFQYEKGRRIKSEKFEASPYGYIHVMEPTELKELIKIIFDDILNFAGI